MTEIEFGALSATDTSYAPETPDTTGLPGHTPLDEPSKLWLPDSVRTRRTASPRARRFADVLKAFGQNFAEWGTGTPVGPCPVNTIEKWNGWKTKGRCEENEHLPYYQVAPQHLQLWRIDHHLNLKDRQPNAKLYLMTGGLNGRAMGMLDADGHNREPDVMQVYRWAAETYFGCPYDEGSDQGHHGYFVVDRRSVSDEEYNRRAHAAHEALAWMAREVRGFQAPIEIKSRIQTYDRLGCITKGGALWAMPNLRGGEESLKRLAGSVPLGIDVYDRIIGDKERLSGRVVVPVPDRSNEPKVAARKATKTKRPRGSDDTFRPQTNDPRDLKRHVVLWLAQGLRRMPTLAEALAEYNKHRDHESDPVRERKMQATIDFVARTFDPDKCGSRNPVGTWGENKARLVALVEQFCTREVFEATDDGKWWGRFSVEKLAAALYAVELKSYTVEKDPDLQFTVGVDWIVGVIRESFGGEGIDSSLPPVFRRVLVKSGLAEMLDSRWRAAMPGVCKGISKKLSIGSSHPKYKEFIRWADAHNVGVVKVADLPPTDGDHGPGERTERRKDISTTPAPVSRGKTARNRRRNPPVSHANAASVTPGNAPAARCEGGRGESEA